MEQWNNGADALGIGVEVLVFSNVRLFVYKCLRIYTRHSNNITHDLHDSRLNYHLCNNPAVSSLKHMANVIE